MITAPVPTEDGATLEIWPFCETLTTLGPLRAKNNWPCLIDRLGQLGLNLTVKTDPANPSREWLE
jgi:hypothetical protein